MAPPRRHKWQEERGSAQKLAFAAAALMLLLVLSSLSAIQGPHSGTPLLDRGRSDLAQQESGACLVSGALARRTPVQWQCHCYGVTGITHAIYCSDTGIVTLV